MQRERYSTAPLELATLHNGVAALLLLSVVALLRFLWTPKTLR